MLAAASCFVHPRSRVGSRTEQGPAQRARLWRNNEHTQLHFVYGNARSMLRNLEHVCIRGPHASCQTNRPGPLPPIGLGMAYCNQAPGESPDQRRPHSAQRPYMQDMRSQRTVNAQVLSLSPGFRLSTCRGRMRTGVQSRSPKSRSVRPTLLTHAQRCPSPFSPSQPCPTTQLLSTSSTSCHHARASIAPRCAHLVRLHL